jgi:hypothetical protein
MTVIPDQYDFTIWEGGTFYESITVHTDGAGSTPRNLTGCTITMKITKRPKGTSFFTLSNNSSVDALTHISTDNANGKIYITLTATETEGLKWKNAFYELTITSGTTVDPILYGNVKVRNS